MPYIKPVDQSCGNCCYSKEDKHLGGDHLLCKEDGELLHPRTTLLHAWCPKWKRQEIRKEDWQ